MSNIKNMQDGSAKDMAEYLNVKPYIPARPVLSLDVFGRETSRCGTVLDAGQAKLTLNARSALAHALLHAKIGRGSSVLVPAYHCPAMVSPLAWLGVDPIFYPIRPDTTVDVEVLAGYLRPDSRALIAVHYFGFIQDMRTLRKFCDTHGLVLIEDCAHAFFGIGHGQPLGGQGDYAIASIMKFIPVYEGGCLVSSRRSLADIKIQHGGLFFQLQSGLNALEMACEYGRLPWLNSLLKSKNRLWRRFKKRRECGESVAQSCEAQDSAGFDFEPAKLKISMSWPSIAIMRAISFSRACSLRRSNYKKMLDAFRDIRGGRPLFAQLPEDVYPQVFPMLMDDPERFFPVLKRKGVPIIRFGEFRWKGVDASVCPVSADLSRRVFQFPCHQSLVGKELDWMIGMIISVLADSENNPSNTAS